MIKFKMGRNRVHVISSSSSSSPVCYPRCSFMVGLYLLVVISMSSSTTPAGCLDLNHKQKLYKGRVVSRLRVERIQRHLDRINKTPLLTILSPDGDTIDCVHKRKQPALDHPLLKHHKIQRTPSEWPRSEQEGDGKRRDYYNNSLINNTMINGRWQLWHQNGSSCPKGTVPVRRSTVDDVLRAQSLYHFGKKRRRQAVIHHSTLARPVNRSADDVVPAAGNIGHEHAIAYYSGASQEVYGAKATINVWEPSVEEDNEFSLSQIWVLSGSFDGPDLNSVEAGWQVSPELYGDTRPRFFTYWTSDSYEATGCYNLMCAGFVQTNSQIAIGGAISPVSSYSGSQYDITLLIWKDPKQGNWWLGFGRGTLVGYWPAELFTHLSQHATLVEWGGEVVNARAVNGEHTSTQMGSGHFAREGFGKASYFRNLEVVDSDNSLGSAQDYLLTLAENSSCYDIKSDHTSDWGSYFYYGGPGRNPNCP